MSNINSEERIINSAISLFSKRNFFDVSVSQIIRISDVSPSTFYKKFKNKEKLIRRIFEKAFKLMDSSLRVRGFTRFSKLIRLTEDYLFFVKDNIEICKTLHEAEFVYPGLYERIKNILMSHLKDLCLKPSDELFWFIWGSVRFISVWSFFWNITEINEEAFNSLIDFILNGIDPDEHVLSDEVFKPKVKPVEYETDTTKAKLLNAAEKLFGTKGFSRTQITDITKEAGVGTGTFYIYFETKIQILKELVERINKNLRLTLKHYISGFEDRRDAEIAGYYTFLEFFRLHPKIYRIVREAEFIFPEVAIWYYKRIHESYQKPLKSAVEKHQIRNIPSEYLAVFLMGIGHFMGKDLLIGSSTSRDFKRELKKLSKLIFKGLKGAVKI